MTSSEQALIARMWQRYAGVAAERVAVLERTAEALATGTASADERRAALTATHKLSGALGTYGRAGSDQARELEQLLTDGGDLSQVPVLVTALRQAVGDPT